MPEPGFSERLRRLLLSAGVALPDWTGIEVALTHTSYVYESATPCDHNERLEFLGDAVLGLCVAESLYRACPGLSPGQMTRIRGSLVSGSQLALVAEEWGLGLELRLGRGEERDGGRRRQSNLSRAIEAVIGAVHLGAGYRAADLVVQEILGDRIAAAIAADLSLDSKTELQELAQERGQTPVYRVLGRTGPDHAPWWTASVAVGETEAVGQGTSLRAAEKQAALRLVGVLQCQRCSPPNQEPR